MIKIKWRIRPKLDYVRNTLDKQYLPITRHTKLASFNRFPILQLVMLIFITCLIYVENHTSSALWRSKRRMRIYLSKNTFFYYIPTWRCHYEKLLTCRAFPQLIENYIEDNHQVIEIDNYQSLWFCRYVVSRSIFDNEMNVEYAFHYNVIWLSCILNFKS